MERNIGKDNTLKNSQILYDGMEVINDAIKGDVFYYLFCSDLKPDYKLIIVNQKNAKQLR